MALPEPSPYEESDEFIIRCMTDDEMQDEFPDYHQRLTVCIFIWDNKDQDL